MSRARYAAGALLVLVLAVGMPWLLWPLGDDDVCAHALSLIPPAHPVQPTMSSCLGTLRVQASREFPWTYAAQRRCYVRAPDMYAFHDCGGELAHLPE